jgi:hypothetical protein
VRALLLGLLFAPLACGGQVAPTDDGGGGPHGDTGTSQDVTSPRPDSSRMRPDTGTTDTGTTAEDAGTDCGQPGELEYMCPKRADAGTAECHRYGGPGDVAPANATFPEGCVVTLTTCDTSFGGAQTCNCELFPGGDAGPQWICPI